MIYITENVRLVVCIICALVAGFCFGARLYLFQRDRWRTRWIELEHDSARKEGRKPRDINDVYKQIY